MAIFLISVSLLLPIFQYLNRNRRFGSAQLETIDQMDGVEFEEYIAFLLKQVGFTKVSVTKQVGDQGIDVIGHKAELSYGFQCKRWKNNVGNNAIQEVHAGKSYYSLDKAIVITNSNYTKSARELAEKLNVELWGRQELIKILEKLKKEQKEIIKPIVQTKEELSEIAESPLVTELKKMIEATKEEGQRERKLKSGSRKRRRKKGSLL